MFHIVDPICVWGSPGGDVAGSDQAQDCGWGSTGGDLRVGGFHVKTYINAYKAHRNAYKTYILV